MASTSQLPIELAVRLKALSNQLVSERLHPSSAFEPSPYLATSAPLFAALHAVNRNSLVFTKGFKAKTQDARLEMDSAHLRLQNLMFERNHLEREIRQCEQFESEHQTLPLLPLEEFLLLAASPDLPPGIKRINLDDSHELMLARLQFELTERQRFDEEKKELGTQKTKLVRENTEKKARLEELEKQLEDFVASARSIQVKMHSEQLAA